MNMLYGPGLAIEDARTFHRALAFLAEREADQQNQPIPAWVPQAVELFRERGGNDLARAQSLLQSGQPAP
jgi:hypothetical protein